MDADTRLTFIYFFKSHFILSYMILFRFLLLIVFECRSNAFLCLKNFELPLCLKYALSIKAAFHNHVGTCYVFIMFTL